MHYYLLLARTCTRVTCKYSYSLQNAYIIICVHYQSSVFANANLLIIMISQFNVYICSITSNIISNTHIVKMYDDLLLLFN